jgi:RecA-family ATPase
MDEPKLFDHNIECALVGGILAVPTPPEHYAGVNSSDFHDIDLRSLFGRIQTLAEDGAYPTYDMLGEIETELFVKLTKHGDTLNTKVLAQQVHDLAARRRLRIRAGELAKLAYDKQRPLEEILARAAKILSEAEPVERQEIEVELTTAPDFVAARGERAPDLLPGHFRAGRIGMVAGSVASGKTHVLLDMAIAAATGGETLGGVKFREPMAVLYCGGDNPREMLQDRLDEMLRGRNIAAPAELVMFEGSFNLASAAGEAKLRRLVEYTNAKLAILDLFTTYVAGADENAANEVAPVFVALRTISNATGATFILAHQLNKAGIIEKAKEWLSAVRGSVGITGSMDFVYTLTQSGEWPSIIRNLRQRKSRDGQEAEDLSFTIEATEDQGRILAWQEGHITNADLQATVLAYVRRYPGKTKGDIATALGKGRTRIFRSVDDLEKQGAVNLEKVGRAVKVRPADTLPGLVEQVSR